MASEETGADQIELLPPDVLYEVLLRLPAKVLCRLRLVCRSWRSITSDPAFIKAHSFRHPLLIGLNAVSGGSCRREVHFIDLFGNVVRRIHTGQAWNIRHLSTDLDLLCVSQEHGKTCVINPRSGVVNVLPGNTMGNAEGRAIFSILGQAPPSSEYKVLRIHCDFMGNNLLQQACDIITLGGGNGRSWRVVPGPPNCVSAASSHRAVVNGVVYFLLYPNAKPDGIAAFGLCTERWRPTPYRGPLNDDQHRTSTPFRLAQLNGSLVTVCSTRHYGDFSIDLWFSEDLATGLWTKRYSLLCAAMSHDGGLTTPVMVLNDGRILISESWKRVLRAYDPRISESVDLAMVATRYHTLVMYQGNLFL